MKTSTKIVAGLGAAVLAVGGVVVIRTLTYKPTAVADVSGIKIAAPVKVDLDQAAAHLSQAIQFKTVSHQNKADDQPAEWDRLQAWLITTYPLSHAAMSRQVVGGKTLIYTWKGSEPALAPIILMAHQDVVPVTPGTEGDWKHPPFAGKIADGAVWGRGSIDDKGSLIGLFESTETLLKAGFKPRRTVILVSGHDEEVRGIGATAAADALKAAGIKGQLVLDEGMAVVKDNPVTGGPVALIGIGEKGYGTLKITAEAPGGHSSAPPEDGGGVVTLSKAVTAIAENPFPMSAKGPGGAMLGVLAAQAPFTLKMAVANDWLFGKMIVKQMSATPTGAALMHTTIAPTMLQGSPKENVLPQDATAWINYRIAPGDTSAKVMAKAKAAVGDLPVAIAWNSKPEEPSAISSTQSEAWKVLAAVAGEVSGAPVAPGLVTAGTDSRYLQDVTGDTYRFQPIQLSLSDTAMIHGTNEHMTLENLEAMVQFYSRLIATAAR